MRYFGLNRLQSAVLRDVICNVLVAENSSCKSFLTTSARNRTPITFSYMTALATPTHCSTYSAAGIRGRHTRQRNPSCSSDFNRMIGTTTEASRRHTELFRRVSCELLYETSGVDIQPRDYIVDTLIIVVELDRVMGSFSSDERIITIMHNQLWLNMQLLWCYQIEIESRNIFQMRFVQFRTAGTYRTLYTCRYYGLRVVLTPAETYVHPHSLEGWVDSTIRGW